MTHPDTFELVQREYYWRSLDYPTCTPVQQIYNTLQACAPDIHAAIAEIQRGCQLLQDANQLFYAEEFYQIVQETSDSLHAKEPAKQAALLRAQASLVALNQQREPTQIRPAQVDLWTDQTNNWYKLEINTLEVAWHCKTCQKPGGTYKRQYHNCYTGQKVQSHYITPCDCQSDHFDQYQHLNEGTKLQEAAS